MSIIDEINEIRRSNWKTEWHVCQLRARSMYNALRPILKEPYTFDGIVFTVWDLWLEQEDSLLCVTFKALGTEEKEGEVLVRPQEIHRIFNPPFLAGGGVDDRLLAGKEMLRGLVE